MKALSERRNYSELSKQPMTTESMQVAVSPKAILQAIEHLKMLCDDAEWWSTEFPRDVESLYRHVGALLAGEDPPELVPAMIAEVGAEGFVGMQMAVGPLGCSPEQMDAMLQPIGTPESFQAAAEWGFIFYRDFFREEPPDGHADGYQVLTVGALSLLQTRAARVAMHQSPLS
jgi:hypothetical protein